MDFGDLDGVWFNGVHARASFRHYPEPNGPLEILAIVPERASNGPIRVKIASEEGLLFGVKGLNYTFRDAFSVTGSPTMPVISSFSAEPATIKEGQSSTLTWQVSPGVEQLTLAGADVSGTNSESVSPTTTTLYELVAKNGLCFQRNQALLVTVIPLPKITAPGNPVYHPGDTLTVNGEGLAQTNASTKVILSQGATSVALTVASPTENQLTVPIPAAFVGGPVNIQAVVGADASNTNAFTLEAKKNGPFVDIQSKIGSASQTCGSKQLQISTNVPGWTLPNLAVFSQAGTILAQQNFQPGLIGGAAFSPGGDEAVSVTADPNGFSASYVNVIERFATHYKFQFPVNIMDGFKTATGRWHVLFSPDDTLVMISSVPSGGPAKIAVQVHDLLRQKNIGTLIQAPCATCDLSAEVMNGNTVVVKLDGAVVATLPVY
ncbi:MAG: IPT/TIG domain-containing protein [Verrucomicrobiia bacterium]